MKPITKKTSDDYIDPTARFRDEELRLKRRGKKLTFAPLDGHWNAEGHRLVAEVLREHSELPVGLRAKCVLLHVQYFQANPCLGDTDETDAQSPRRRAIDPVSDAV